LVEVTQVDAPKIIKASDDFETQVLRGRPVFVVLNKHTLSIFENENVNSLITSINVRTLAAPATVTALARYNCFQLHDSPSAIVSREGQHPYVVPHYDPAAQFTFCAATPSKQGEWEQAIIDFDNCKPTVETPADQLNLQEQIER